MDEILHNASQTYKPVFVDVYTDWCGPCKRIDRSTFVDSAVGTYFNDAFISLKANAEDKNYGTLIANQYEVSGYPTLLFLSSNGELIMMLVGMQTKYELLERAAEAIELYKSLDYLKSVKANIYSNYSKEDLQGILSLSNHHPFEGKEQLSMRYLDMIKAISEEDLRLVLGEMTLIDFFI
ncbi:MAG: thiol-disulfide isomerase/thioredoxin [Saprospiraceae bacterium]